MARVGDHYKRTGPARPKTCPYCQERHYVSIMCEQKMLALNPPPEVPPEPPRPFVPLPLPAKSPRAGYRLDPAGNLVLIRPPRPFQNVIRDPNWDAA